MMKVFYMIILISISVMTIQAQDTWIREYDPLDIDGWSTWFYEPLNVIVCQDGGYAVNGMYRFSGWPDIPYAEEAGFLMRTDSDGNVLWARKDTVSWLDFNEGTAFVQTQDGDFISAGYRIWTGGGNYLIRRDSEGNRIWARDTYEFRVESMVLAEDGNIVLAGGKNDRPAIRKITPDGDTVFEKIYHIHNDNEGHFRTVENSQSGGFVLSLGLYLGHYEAEVFVMKTNAEGDTLWTRRHIGDETYDTAYFAVENADGCILTGGRIGTLPSTYFLWMLNSDGDSLWFELDSPDSMFYGQVAGMVLPDNSFTIMCGSGKIRNIDTESNLNWYYDNDFMFVANGNAIDIAPDQSYIGLIYGNTNYINLVKLNQLGQVIGIKQDYAVVEKADGIFCYPNPFNPLTIISFNVTEEHNIDLSIFNIRGQLVKTLYDGFLNSGTHEIIWNGKNQDGTQASSGIYLVILRAGDETKFRKKITLMK